MKDSGVIDEMDQPLEPCRLHIVNAYLQRIGLRFKANVRSQRCLFYHYQVTACLTEVLVCERSKEHAFKDRGSDGQHQLVRGDDGAVSEAESDVAPLLLVIELADELWKEALALPPVLPLRLHRHTVPAAVAQHPVAVRLVLWLHHF